DRYANAEELAADLTRFLNYEPVKARRISPFGRLWRFAQRHPSITIVSTAATAAVLAVSTWAYVRVVHERDKLYKAYGIANLARAETERALAEANNARDQAKAAQSETVKEMQQK